MAPITLFAANKHIDTEQCRAVTVGPIIQQCHNRPTATAMVFVGGLGWSGDVPLCAQHVGAQNVIQARQLENCSYHDGAPS